jgi:hypothetical protein
MSEYEILKAEYENFKIRLSKLETLREQAERAWSDAGYHDKKTYKELSAADKNFQDMRKSVKALAYNLVALEHKEFGTPINKLSREYGMSPLTIKKLLREADVAYLRPTLVQWLPIGTAPKDDTDVLVFCNGNVLIGSFAAGMWWIQQTSYEKHDPTYWMPLPKPPALGEKHEERGTRR